MKRLGVLVVAIIGLAAAPAAAGGYPPGDNIMTVSDATPCPGQAFTIQAKTFTPGTTVTVTLLPNAVLGTPTADANGSISLDVTLSSTQAQGKQTIQAQGAGVDKEGQILTLTSSVEVVSCTTTPPTTTPATTPSGGGGNLPKTGSDSTLPLLQIGGGFAAAGGVLVALAAARKRRTQPAHLA